MDNDRLESILQTLQSLQNDVTNCKSRLALFESRLEQQKTTLERDCDYDTIFLLKSEDIALDSVNEEGTIKPSNEAELPTNEAIKQPNEATKPSNDTSNSGNVNSSSNENTEGACYDPDASVTSWKPSKDFSSLLEKNFRRKLSYNHVLDVLETNSVLSVDALASPTLDLAIINQISNPLSKKYVQERGKEMVSVQRSLLNATGPLCCLHDALESNDNINVSNKDVKFMLEQALCLLGSANYQIAINKAKVNLGDLPLPNAKRMLFGDDFPSLTSKQADLSRGLSKNLSSNARREFFSSTQRFGSRRVPMRSSFNSGSFTSSKYAPNRPKNRFFRPQRTVQQESTSTYLSGSKERQIQKC